MAQVLNLTHQTTADVYRITDGTGEIEARHWVEARTNDDMEEDTDNTPYVIIRAVPIYLNSLCFLQTPQYLRANRRDHSFLSKS